MAVLPVLPGGVSEMDAWEHLDELPAGPPPQEEWDEWEEGEVTNGLGAQSRSHEAQPHQHGSPWQTEDVPSLLVASHARLDLWLPPPAPAAAEAADEFDAAWLQGAAGCGTINVRGAPALAPAGHLVAAAPPLPPLPPPMLPQPPGLPPWHREV